MAENEAMTGVLASEGTTAEVVEKKLNGTDHAELTGEKTEEPGQSIPPAASAEQDKMKEPSGGDGKNDNTEQKPGLSKEAKEYMRKADSQAWATSNRSKKYAEKNIKSRFDDLPESNDVAEICKQVEFYFSDSNLTVDKYLFNLVQGSNNKPTPVKTIHSFKRMRRFQPYSAVVEALRQSETLEITVGENGEELVARKTPLPAEAGTEFDPDVVEALANRNVPRSIYAKGFGEEDEHSQLDIEAYFQQFGDVVSVRLRRRFPKQLFKGSVFVEFGSVELQQQFLAFEKKPKYKGTHELVFMSKKDYLDNKKTMLEENKIDPKKFGNWNKSGDRGRRGDHATRGQDRRARRKARREAGSGSDDKDDWNARRDKFQKTSSFRGHGGRGNRDSRSASPSHDNKPGDSKKQKYDENGAPISEDQGKKRAREEEDEDRDPSPSKKAKAAEHGYD